jgi:hypothetical protein
MTPKPSPSEKIYPLFHASHSVNPLVTFWRITLFSVPFAARTDYAVTHNIPSITLGLSAFSKHEPVAKSAGKQTRRLWDSYFWKFCSVGNRRPSVRINQTLRRAHHSPTATAEVNALIMRIKPTISHEDTLIYYTTDVVNFLHVTDTYCGHLQGGVFFEEYTTKNIKTNLQI